MTKESWQLAKNDDESLVTEFELYLWRVFYSFIKWQEDCQQLVNGTALDGYELSLLHVIRMCDRPKSIYEVGRILNRTDPSNIQYGVTKLVTLGLIEKVKPEKGKKTHSYKATKMGIAQTEKYAEARQELLLKAFKSEQMSQVDLKKVSSALSTIRNIYEESTLRCNRIPSDFTK